LLFLTLQRGDVLYVRDSAEEGWLEGELDGRIGLLPAPYVQFLQKEGRIPQNHAAERRFDGDERDRGSHRMDYDPYHKRSDADAKDSGSNDWNSPYASTPQDGWKEGLDDDDDVGPKSHDKSTKVNEMKDLASRQHTLLSARSRKLAANRRPDKGNYGEYLYLEGA
jgi:hypothetical protein